MWKVIGVLLFLTCASFAAVENGLETTVLGPIGRRTSSDATATEFNYNTKTRLISAVKFFTFTYNGVEYLSGVGFKHGELDEYPIHSTDVNTGTSEEFQLIQDEYITEVNVEFSFPYINRLQFITNTGKSITKGPSVTGSTTLRAYNNGAPLLYISGFCGLFVYEMKFTFLAYDVKSADMVTKTQNIAKEVFDAIKYDLDKLPEIQQQNQWMLPDIVTRTCFRYSINQEQDAKIACSLQYLLNQLNTLHQSVQAFNRHEPRQLMAYSNYDTNKLLQTAQTAKDFHNAITSIQFTVQQSAQITVDLGRKLGNYFKEVASFDKNIAQQDEAFIAGKLSELKKATQESTSLVEERIRGILIHALVANTADLAQKIGQLAAEIAAQANPIKQIFSTAPNDLFDRIDAVAQAASNVQKTSVLLGCLKKYVSYLKEVNEKLAKNGQSTERLGMKKIFDTFDGASREDQQVMVKTFVDNYGAYTPAVGLQDLAYGSQLLSTVAATACELLFAGDSAAANVVQGVADIHQYCVYVDSDIAKLGTINEEIYNFQFDIIDAFTKMVRASIAESMANEINQISNTIDLTTAAIGSMMVEIAYQSTAHARCMVIEYSHGGKRPLECQRLLFTNNDIASIIGYTGNAIDNSLSTRYAYIPTEKRTVASDDAVTDAQVDIGAWIDVDEFIAGKEYTVPLLSAIGVDWLVEHGWLLEHELSSKPEATYYIKAFEAYVPGVKCENDEQADITVIAKSSEFTQLFLEEAPATYMHKPTTYTFTYNEHKLGNNCPTGSSNVEPFEVRGNTDRTPSVKQLCVVSKGQHALSTPEVLPSVFSLWTLKLVAPSSCKLVKVDSASKPMITVKLDVIQLHATGINECWPRGSRCATRQYCQDRVKSFVCVNNSRKRTLQMLLGRAERLIEEMEL